jgi:hypothetical protein
VLAPEHLLHLAGIDLGAEFLEAAQQIGGHVFPAAGPLQQHAQIRQPPAQGIAQVDVFAQAPTPLQDALGFGLIFPEVGLAYPRFEPLEFTRR